MTILRSKMKSLVFLVLILAIGGFMRFYKLDWGDGYFFHPDEYHIASSVKRLNFPSQMNPQFFSYGSFISYLIYFSREVLGIFNSQVLGVNPILIGRFYSALFSTLTIFLVYLVAERVFKDKSQSLVAAGLVSLMPGLIQQAHFTTPESVLTFWIFLFLYFGLRWFEESRLRFLYLAAISLGIGVGTKIVALAFLPVLMVLPLLSLFRGTVFQCVPERGLKSAIPKKKSSSALQCALLAGGLGFKLLIFSLLLVFLAFLVVYPYSVLDWEHFRSSMNYETGVGRGEPVVFYTRQFIDTTLVVFQFKRILPYALGPTLLAGVLGLVWLVVSLAGKIVRRDKGSWEVLVLLLGFLVYFVPSIFLFAKWTRFIAPVFPFFAIFASYFLLKCRRTLPRALFRLLVTSYQLLITSYCFMFFSIYLRPDVRVSATQWIIRNLPEQSFVLTEAGNMLEVPLEGPFEKKSFDFYNLEGDDELYGQLVDYLEHADYFIIQSRRIFVDHQRLPEQFPITARFYDLLFSGSLGFNKIAEFSSYPKLEIACPEPYRRFWFGGDWKLEIPDEMAEETWSVFDHPVVRIYKKVRPLRVKDYEKLLQI